MRLAIITDIHEDIVNLQEALRKIDKMKVDNIACLGDISGFSAIHYTYQSSRNAHECLKLVKKSCKFIVLGNHDMHAAHVIPKEAAFFDFPNNWYELDYHDRNNIAGNIMWFHEEDDLNPLYKKDDIDFIKTLPEFEIIESDDMKFMLSHYIYPNLSGLKREFYTYRDEFRQHFEFMNNKNISLSFTGHSHNKGFFVATEKKYKEYRYKSFKLSDSISCVGIPPVTSHRKRGGFCIFDSDDYSIQVIKI